MILHSNNLSPFASRCRLQIHLKSLDIEINAINNDEEFAALKAVNPIGKIPILELDNGEKIPESRVILEYIEDIFPSSPLRPESPESKARMRLLGQLSDLYLMEVLLTMFPHLNPKVRDPAFIDKQLGELHLGLTHLDTYLNAEDEFAVGENPTLADCMLVPVLFFVFSFLPAFGDSTSVSQWEKVDRYWAKIQKTEPFTRVIAELSAALEEKMAPKK